MKKIFIFLATIIWIALSVNAQEPTVHWRFANESVYLNGTDCILEFDVQVSCDMAGTYHSDMQLYFDYNTLAFGANIVANGKITYQRLELLQGDFAGTPLYAMYGNIDNSPSRYALLSEATFVVANSTFMNEVPMLPVWGGYARFQIIVADQGQLAGIDFVPQDGGVGIMDGGQYYVDATHPTATKYGVPPGYQGVYENDLLMQALSCLPCPPLAVWTGAINEDWNLPGNWDVAAVPCITTDVTIPAGLTNYPTCYNPGECNNIYFESNTAGTATILDNGILTVGGTATYERYYTTIQGALFSDDFEDGNVTEYCQTNNFTASMNMPHTGSWSGMSTSTATGHYNSGRICMTDETPEYVSYWIYPTTTGPTAYFVMTDGASGAGTAYQVLFLYVFTGAWRCFGNPALVGPAVTPNQWYHIEFYFDWTNRNFDWYVDGTLVQANMNFRGASAFNVDNVDLYAYNSGVTTYYDDIYIGNAGGGGGGAAWHLTSSPIADGMSGIYLGQYLQNYDDATEAWTDIIPVDIPLVPMNGYGFWATGGNTAYYTGTLNTGVYSQTLVPAGTYGWNLLGNPYPSSVDWDLVTKPGYMNGAVYYLDAASGNYVSYNGGMGGGTRYVPPVQGFFVSATGAGPFTFDNSVRTHMDGSAYYKSEMNNMVEVVATGNGYSDETFIRFDESATAGFDGQYDAYKLFGLEYNNYLPQLYTVSGDNLSINVQPEAKAIPMSFRAGVDGKYTISAGEVRDIEYLYLRDLVTGQITNLNESSYAFTYKSGDNDARFMLHFSPFGANEGSVNIYSYGQDIFVTLPEDVQGEIYIYNVMGQLISTHATNGTFNQIGMDQGGNYVVKVLTNAGTETQKVNVR